MQSAFLTVPPLLLAVLYRMYVPNAQWLGLEHTFASDFDANNTCNQADNNDYLEDTPQQAGPSNLFYETCTAYFNDTLERLDTCPDLPGNDLVVS